MALASDSRPLTDPPDPNPRQPTLRLPPGAWDCLIHVYGDPDRYPFHPLNPYRSMPTLPETYIRQQDFLGLARAVIANGAGYGSDSRYLLETLERFPQRFVGVTYVEPDVTLGELKALRAAGVLGCRFAGGPAYKHLPDITLEMAGRLADAGMHVEYLTFTHGGLSAAKELLASLPTKLVIDHFGRLDATKGLNDPGFTALLDLLDTGRVWVKMSNPGFCTKEDHPFPSITPYARKLAAHAPERILWGSNWPHVMKMGRAMPNDGDLVNLIAEWVPHEAARRQMLVSNPAYLYGSA
jgi:2-pyrone-4,6-dicarboxylate lactonase